jgi:hypothetical protein
MEKLMHTPLENARVEVYNLELPLGRAAVPRACNHPNPNKWPSSLEVFPREGRKLGGDLRTPETHASSRNVERVDGGYGNLFGRLAERACKNPRLRSVHDRTRVDVYRPYTIQNGECALRLAIHSVNDRAT